jgi:hypothetical protein
MAHTNDLMYAVLSAEYGEGLTLGDYLYELRGEVPTFGGPLTRAWYVTKLGELGLSAPGDFAENAHLADLANLFWSQADPFSVIP